MGATQLQEEIQAYVREELDKLKLKDGKLTQDELKAAAEYLAALREKDCGIKADFLCSHQMSWTCFGLHPHALRTLAPAESKAQRGLPSNFH
jgi:hypothetical protein